MTAKKRGWRWSFVPRRLLTNERFLNLSHLDANVLLRLYLGCTAYGRFNAGKMSLAITLGILDPEACLIDRLGHLEAEGFVTIYDVEGQSYGRVNGYDEDAPGDLIRKRGPAVIPVDPAISANRPPTVRQPSAEIREEKKRIDREEKGALAPYGEA